MQHAYNPVDWYPWAIKLSKRLKQEISLSSYLLGIADFFYKIIELN
ncbi:thioredoxin domain-containing protein [Pelosinus sp. UFO1]|nr:thioredoxin domain-containing protein [Pelosinus sp. UFO1]